MVRRFCFCVLILSFVLPGEAAQRLGISSIPLAPLRVDRIGDRTTPFFLQVRVEPWIQRYLSAPWRAMFHEPALLEGIKTLSQAQDQRAWAIIRLLLNERVSQFSVAIWNPAEFAGMKRSRWMVGLSTENSEQTERLIEEFRSWINPDTDQVYERSLAGNRVLTLPMHPQHIYLTHDERILVVASDLARLKDYLSRLPHGSNQEDWPEQDASLRLILPRGGENTSEVPIFSLFRRASIERIQLDLAHRINGLVVKMRVIYQEKKLHPVVMPQGEIDLDLMDSIPDDADVFVTGRSLGQVTDRFPGEATSTIAESALLKEPYALGLRIRDSTAEGGQISWSGVVRKPDEWQENEAALVELLSGSAEQLVRDLRELARDRGVPGYLELPDYEEDRIRMGDRDFSGSGTFEGETLGDRFMEIPPETLMLGGVSPALLCAPLDWSFQTSQVGEGSMAKFWPWLRPHVAPLFFTYSYHGDGPEFTFQSANEIAPLLFLTNLVLLGEILHEGDETSLGEMLELMRNQQSRSEQ